MRKILSVALLLALLLPPGASAKDSFTIGITCPAETKCTAVELEAALTEAYARAGYSVDFVYMPRLRTLFSVDVGETDAIAVSSRGALPGHPNIRLLPTPLIKVVVSAFTIGPGISISSPQDLEKYNVGVIRGQLLAVRLAKEHAHKVEEINTISSLVGMLRNGRVDALLLNRSSAHVFLADAGLFGYVESEPLTTSYLFHGINTAAYEPDQPEKIDKALREMIEDGTLKRLYGRLHELAPTLPLPKNP